MPLGKLSSPPPAVTTPLPLHAENPAEIAVVKQTKTLSTSNLTKTEGASTSTAKTNDYLITEPLIFKLSPSQLQQLEQAKDSYETAKKVNFQTATDAWLISLINVVDGSTDNIDNSFNNKFKTLSDCMLISEKEQNGQKLNKSDKALKRSVNQLIDSDAFKNTCIGYLNHAKYTDTIKIGSLEHGLAPKVLIQSRQRMADSMYKFVTNSETPRWPGPTLNIHLNPIATRYHENWANRLAMPTRFQAIELSSKEVSADNRVQHSDDEQFMKSGANEEKRIRAKTPHTYLCKVGMTPQDSDHFKRNECFIQAGANLDTSYFSMTNDAKAFQERYIEFFSQKHYAVTNKVIAHLKTIADPAERLAFMISVLDAKVLSVTNNSNVELQLTVVDRLMVSGTKFHNAILQKASALRQDRQQDYIDLAKFTMYIEYQNDSISYMLDNVNDLVLDTKVDESQLLSLISNDEARRYYSHTNYIAQVEAFTGGRSINRTHKALTSLQNSVYRGTQEYSMILLNNRLRAMNGAIEQYKGTSLSKGYLTEKYMTEAKNLEYLGSYRDTVLEHFRHKTMCLSLFECVQRCVPKSDDMSKQAHVDMLSAIALSLDFTNQHIKKSRVSDLNEVDSEITRFLQATTSAKINAQINKRVNSLAEQWKVKRLALQNDSPELFEITIQKYPAMIDAVRYQHLIGFSAKTQLSSEQKASLQLVLGLPIMDRIRVQDVGFELLDYMQDAYQFRVEQQEASRETARILLTEEQPMKQKKTTVPITSEATLPKALDVDVKSKELSDITPATSRITVERPRPSILNLAHFNTAIQQLEAINTDSISPKQITERKQLISELQQLQMQTKSSAPLTTEIEHKIARLFLKANTLVAKASVTDVSDRVDNKQTWLAGFARSIANTIKIDHIHNRLIRGKSMGPTLGVELTVEQYDWLASEWHDKPIEKAINLSLHSYLEPRGKAASTAEYSKKTLKVNQEIRLYLTQGSKHFKSSGQNGFCLSLHLVSGVHSPNPTEETLQVYHITTDAPVGRRHFIPVPI